MMTRQQDERAYWDNAAFDDTIIFDEWLTHETQETVYEFLKWHHGSPVLEFGCGTGRILDYVARSLPNRQFHGIDISHEMLRKAFVTVPDNVTLSATDGRKPETDLKFAAAYCVTVFQHLKPSAVESWIHEIADLLEDDGAFLFQFIVGDEHEPFSNHYHLDQIDAWLAAAGLTIKRTYSAVHESWTWVEAVKS